MTVKKTALITGASRGIGREIAKLFAKNNYNVVINYNNSQKEAEELLEELTKENCSVRIFKADVSNVNEAIDHINKHSSKHSETIVTENNENAVLFLNGIDSACVYHNASTRFTDGGEFGFGAEIGISTAKLHARGPMGLKEITTYKYIISGNGQVR